MKLRSGAAGLGAFALFAGSTVSGCILPVDSSGSDPGSEQVGEATSPLDHCTHTFVFSPAPGQCNDLQGKGAKIRAGTDKVPATGCEVVDIDTYSGSCEPSLCSGFTTWPAGHDDETHRLAAEAECQRICEAPGRACVSLGVAVRSLSTFSPTSVSQCWDGLGNNASCGNSPEENPADWIPESPCPALVGASCGTAFQRHDTYACLCQQPDGGLGEGGNPLGGPGAGAVAPGCHCQLGAPGEGAVGGLAALLATMGLAGRRVRAGRSRAPWRRLRR